MGVRKTTSQFIQECSIKHNNKYDYSLVDYKNSHEEVTIICPVHGEFQQTPTSHSCGSGCIKCRTSKRQQTMLDKYGVSNYTQSSDFHQKRKITMIEKYGVEHSSQSEELITKRKETCLEKYGVEHPFSCLSVREKTKNTNLLKYGVENPQQNKKIREKTKNTNLLKYGVEHHWSNKEIQQKIKQTFLRTYGCHSPLLNLEILEKIKQTNLERYGVEYYTQTEEIIEKRVTTNRLKYKVDYHSQQHMIESIPLLDNPIWLFDQYINQNKTATQIADEIGVDGTTVCNYLRFHEIEIRQTFWISYKCVKWLKLLEEQENIIILPEYQFDESRKQADGYCVETNTIYEFYGDYWHGNPNVYSPEEVNNVSGKSMGELYQNTIERENKIKSLGFNLVVIWEADFK